MPHLFVTEADKEGREILFGEAVVGNAVVPGAGVFGVLGEQDGLAVHVMGTGAGGDKAGGVPEEGWVGHCWEEGFVVDW